MEIFKPSEFELRKSGLSRSSYDDNWLACAKVSGIHLFSKPFSVVYHSSRALAFFSMLGFIYGGLREGDKENSLDCFELLLMFFVLYAGCCAFGFYHEDYLAIIRMIDKGGFDYKGTLTRENEEEIARFRAQTKRIKQIIKKICWVIVVSTILLLGVKKPLGILIRGRGKKLIDGEHNLVWNGAFGMYTPFADTWIAYILSITFSNVFACWGTVANGGYVTTFVFICEELLCEFTIVNCTMSRCVERAKILYASRARNHIETKNGQLTSETTMEECLQHCINLSIKHHHQTLQAYDSFKKIMYLPLLLLIVCWAVATCVTVYLILSEDVSVDFKLPLPMFITSEAVVAFLFCYCGQRLTNACEAIGSSIYDDPDWFEYITVLRQYISIVTVCNNVPNELSAGGFTYMNHITFSNMISTAYTYIGFLLST